VRLRNLLCATIAAIVLTALIAGNRPLLCAQEVNDKDLPVSLRPSPVPPEPPKRVDEGSWLGTLTQLECSRIRVLSNDSGFSVRSRRLRIETIEFHRRRHEPSVLVIATRLQEQRALDKEGTANLGQLKPGRYVIKIRTPKEEALGTVDFPEGPGNCIDELPITKFEGKWYIGEVHKKTSEL
jgi:hypothetical protein